MKNIRKLQASDVVIAPFDPKCDTKLYVDRSPVGVAATLMQRSDEGHYQMVNHTCRAQTPVECRYSQTEGESLAIEYGVIYHRPGRGS